MPWAKKNKSKSDLNAEEEFYSTSQQERLDDLFQKGGEAFSEKDGGREDNFTRTGRKVRVGALVISAMLFVGYLIVTSEDKEVSQVSPSQTKLVADSPSTKPDNSGIQYRPKPQSLPKNGTIHSFAQGQRPALLKVNTSGGDHHLIKLTKPGSTEAVMYLFIRAGQSAQMRVLLGNFEIKWAAGTEWYGYEKEFGESTHYQKDPDLYRFEKNDKWTLTLYPVSSGNMSSKTISADEF
jgi:hypothetical protein